MKRALGLALALVVSLPGVAGAAELHGTQTDPVGDGTVIYGLYGGSPLKPVDVVRVEASYDPELGRIEVQFHGEGIAGYHRSGLHWQAGFKAPDAGGRCDATWRAGDYLVVGSETGRQADVWYSDRATISEPALSPNEIALDPDSEDAAYENQDILKTDGPRITVHASRLQRRNLRCVTAVYAEVALADTGGGVDPERPASGFDWVADFRLGGDPPPPPPTVAPQAFTASGGALTWNPVGGVTRYIVATSEAPEGQPGRKTTYTTVEGASWQPPAAPGQRRWYGVRAAVDGSRWAQPEVEISFAALPPPPPEPAAPLQAVLPPVVVADPPPVTATPTTPAGPSQAVATTPAPVTPLGDKPATPAPAGGPKLGLKASQLAIRRKLADRFGKEFRDRSTFTLTCRRAGDAVVVCAVKWRTKRYSYRGTTTARADEDDVRVAAKVERKRRHG